MSLPIEAERFRPAVDRFGYAVTESSATARNLQIVLGAWGSYEDDSAVLFYEGARVRGPAPDSPDGMLDRRSVVDLQLGFGIGNRFSFVADAPLVVWQSGFEPAAEQSPVATADLVASGPGDLRLTPKLVLVDVTDQRPVGLTLLATGTVPTGSTRSFIGEGNATIAPMMVLEAANRSVRGGEYQVRGALNAGARLKTPDRFREQVFGSELLYRAALSVRPLPLLEVGGDLAGAVAGVEAAHAPAEVLPWLRLHGGDLVALTAGGGVGLNPGLGAPDYRVFGGLTLAPQLDRGSLDRDGDAIPNPSDLCAAEAEDPDGFEDDDGCADDDNDGDGITDRQDSCRDSAEDFDGFADADGCPDPDNDEDGVVDGRDRCVDVPEDRDGFQDLDGCPEPDNDGDYILDLADQCPMAAENTNGVDDGDGCPEDWADKDKDGLHDAADTCPSDAEDVDGFRDDDGCLDPDNDGDAVPDGADQCPFEPENRNGYLDDDGCVDAPPERVTVESERIVIHARVAFEYNRAVIEERSYDLLTEVAAVIADHPAFTRIQVEGHTDDDGTEAYNLKLSQARAEAVVAYLTRSGVDPRRLVAKGFGESLPIDSNDTARGKARNRRVEFTILEQDPSRGSPGTE